MAGNIIRDERVRKSGYHVVAAALAIGGIWGFFTAEQIGDYIQAAVLILGTGGSELAAANTPAKPEPDYHDNVEGAGR